MAYIGIDIGGTKTNIALVRGGAIAASLTIPTASFDDTVAGIGNAVRSMAETTHERIVAAGIGCPGPMNENTGEILNADTLTGWYGRNLLEALQTVLGVPAVLRNDADTALLGEIEAGSLKEFAEEPVVMLTFGTGVGGAAWDGAKLLSGAYGEHPEIGHMQVDPLGPSCYCGARGCVEVIAAGPALHAAAMKAGFADFGALAASTDADKNQVVLYARQAISATLWNLAHTLRPAAVALGGGLMEAFYGLLVDEGATEKASMLIQPMAIRKASLGNLAGVVGAASMAARIRLS